MPTSGPSGTFVVYFDGQFWVGHYEREVDGRVEVARHVFGPEPSLPEIADFVCGPRWSQLRFVPVDLDGESSQALAGNPKRRQREAARLSQAPAPSTKAQAAFKAALEAEGREAGVIRKEHRHADAEKEWERRVAKRKQKNKGH